MFTNDNPRFRHDVLEFRDYADIAAQIRAIIREKSLSEALGVKLNAY